MTTRKRPRLEEPSSEITITLFQRQKKWVARIAARRRGFSAAVVRDAVDVYRAVVLSFGQTALPDIKQLTITVRAALVAYLAQQRADTQAGASPAGTDTAPQAEAEAGGMNKEGS